MRLKYGDLLALLAVLAFPSSAWAQALGVADRGEPGDQVIQDYLAQQTKKLSEFVLGSAHSARDWQKLRPGFRDEYFYMLGLSPLPAVFYVCGHAGQGRNGSKTAYQSHGIWFARHGYVCLRALGSKYCGRLSPGLHGNRQTVSGTR